MSLDFSLHKVQFKVVPQGLLHTCTFPHQNMHGVMLLVLWWPENGCFFFVFFIDSEDGTAVRAAASAIDSLPRTAPALYYRVPLSSANIITAIRQSQFSNHWAQDIIAFFKNWILYLLLGLGVLSSGCTFVVLCVLLRRRFFCLSSCFRLVPNSRSNLQAQAPPQTFAAKLQILLLSLLAHVPPTNEP